MSSILAGQLKFTKESDLFGAATSTLCMIHCIATPFIFLAQANHTSCGELGPWWWHTIDYIFLLVAFVAIYYTHKSTSITWVIPVMYISWLMLALVVVNAKVNLLPLPGLMIYLPACSLIFLHIYNRKYCNCSN